MHKQQLVEDAPAAAGRRQMLVAGALAAGGFAVARAGAASVSANGGISRTAASIHQEPVFAASGRRLYAALTDAAQFDQVVRLSSAMQGVQSKVQTSIDATEGGAFALFGGYITGRQVELVPDELIVQAWRAGSWGPGLYSIARFQIKDQGAGSVIIFDHGGFPDAEAEHLAAGWQANYWTPLAKFLSR